MPNEKRLLVIENSILIESAVATFLGLLLEIDTSTSKILGNSSLALTFKQKLYLVGDLKQANSIDFPKFEKLAESEISLHTTVM